MSISQAIPFWEKYTLSIQEASEYFRIGEKKLRILTDDNPDADYILCRRGVPPTEAHRTA